MEIKKNYPLKELTTLKVGGPARYFVKVSTEEEVARALTFARKQDLNVFVLGGGSNILVSDYGFDGLVIKNEIKGIETKIKRQVVLLTVGAGENWDDIVGLAVKNNWQGIECLSGIPGTLGAAPIQNINAYGQSFESVCRQVVAVDIKNTKAKTFKNGDCEFSYRDSLFKRSTGRYLITRITLELKRGGDPLLEYRDFQERFSDLRGKPDLRDVRKAVIEVRAKKGYVILPGYECYKSAGSFFLNPIVESSEFRRIRSFVERWKSKNTVKVEGATRSGCPDPWFWELPTGKVKLGAACLMETAGFHPGYKKGKVAISPKHALALINLGGAKAKDVLDLAKKIQDRVYNKFSILIEPEVQFVGFKKSPLGRYG